LQEMIEKHGVDFSEDDPDVWARVVAPRGGRKRVFGIGGCSDLNYVVTGKPSSSYGVTQSYTEQLSQKKVCFYCYYYYY
jgi:hypothetical protein